jgi:hypothetical protein
MKKQICMCLIIIVMLSGCAVSSIFRQGVEQSSDEYAKWVQMFKSRLDKMPDKEIAPFTIWIITIIGDDKERLPREAEKLIDRITMTVTQKPDDYVFSKRERAELMGSWDRLFVILYEEAARKSISLIKRIMTAGII